MAKKISPYGNFVEDDVEKVIYFYGSIFSNWARTPFKMDTIVGVKEFPTSEHAFMWMKAFHFNDRASADRILEIQDPQQVKQIGRQVKNYDDGEWGRVRYGIMVDVLKAKFRNNKLVYRELVRYKDYSFVEASPVDRIWGIGLGCDDHRIYMKDEWLGENLLGNAIMDVRDELKPYMPREKDLH